MDGMGMLGIITTMHTACGGEREGEGDSGVVGGDKQVGGASTNDGSPRACKTKSRDGKREDESRAPTIHDFPFSHREKVDVPP
jgi:hypothetical protein